MSNTFNKVEVNAVLVALIGVLSGSERITKDKLGEFSRIALDYIVPTSDIQPINQLLAVLTPANKRVAAAFFKAFIPFNLKDGLFVAGINKKTREDKYAAITEWLIDETNNIWSWDAEQQAPPASKPKDFKDLITKMVKKSLKEGDDQIQGVDVMSAVLAAGISADDMIRMLALMGQDQVEQAEPIAEAA